MTGAICPNCCSERAAEYCPRCGQSQEEARVSIGRWLADTARELAAVDGKLAHGLAADAARALGDTAAEAGYRDRFRVLFPSRHEIERATRGHGRELDAYARAAGLD